MYQITSNHKLVCNCRIALFLRCYMGYMIDTFYYGVLMIALIKTLIRDIQL